MKSLQEYINEHYSNDEQFIFGKDYENDYLTFENFVKESNIILTDENKEYNWLIYEDNKFNNISVKFPKERNYSSYEEYKVYIYKNIFENLEKFNNKVSEIEDIKGTEFIHDKNYLLRLVANKSFDVNKLQKYCDKFNVFISDIKDLQFNKIIFVEENDLPNSSEIIYKKLNGILYHITTRENADKILRYGLEPRSEHKKSWHPERIYFIINRNNAESLYNELYKENSNKNMVILKIDLNKIKNHKLDFFEDPKFENGEAYFTKESIPNYCISEIYKKEFFLNKIFGFLKKLIKK